MDISIIDLYTKLAVSLLPLLIATIGPYYIFKRKHVQYAMRFISRQWIVVVSWFCLLLFCILLDGEFLNSGLVHTIGMCASILSGIFVLSNTLEKLTIKKGDITLQADIYQKGSKSQTEDDESTIESEVSDKRKKQGD